MSDIARALLIWSDIADITSCWLTSGEKLKGLKEYVHYSDSSPFLSMTSTSSPLSDITIFLLSSEDSDLDRCLFLL